MKIKKVVLRKLQMDLKFPFQTSFGTEEHRKFIITEVHGENHIGYGECVVNANPFYNEETVQTAWHIMKDFLIPFLFQKEEILHPNEVHDIFRQVRRHNMAKSALEGAIWDLYAKEQGEPLADVIGGEKKKISVGVSIGIQKTKEDLVETVGNYLEKGFQKIKIKIKPGKDIEMLQAVRDQFGDIPMMADANSAYTLEDINLFKQMDHLNLMMFEQPLAHDDIIDHARLQEEIKTPICLDESIHSVEDARKAIELGSCKIINIKIGRVGGIAEAIKIHNLCKEKQIPVWCGGMLESGIGRAHNLAITSLNNFTIPGDTAPSARYWEEDIIQPEIQMNDNGEIELSAKPGLGYEINQDALERYTVGIETFPVLYSVK